MQQPATSQHSIPKKTVEQQFAGIIPSYFREQCIRVASRGDNSGVSSLNPNIEWLLDRIFQWIIQHIPIATSKSTAPSSGTEPKEQQRKNAPSTNSDNNDAIDESHQQRVVAVVAVLLSRFIRAIVGTHQHTFTLQKEHEDGEDIIITQSAVQILQHVVTDVTQLINNMKAYETTTKNCDEIKNKTPTFEKLIQNFIVPWLRNQLDTDDQLDIPISKMTRWTPLLRLFAIALEFSKRNSISSSTATTPSTTTANDDDTESNAKNSCPKPFFRLLQLLFETTIEASNQSCISYQDFIKVWDYLRKKTSSKTTEDDNIPRWMDTIIDSIPGEIPGMQHDDINDDDGNNHRQRKERHLSQIVWKLSCFWFHHLQSQEMLRDSSSNGCSSNGNHIITKWKVPSKDTIRHQRLLCSAATIGFVALLSFFLLPPLPHKNDNNEPATKRRKLSNISNPIISDKSDADTPNPKTDPKINATERNSLVQEQQSASLPVLVTPESILQHLQDGANSIIDTSHLPNAAAILKFEIEAMTKFVMRTLTNLESDHHRQGLGDDKMKHLYSNFSYTTVLPESHGNLMQLIMARLRIEELAMRKKSQFLKQVNKILVSLTAATSSESKQPAVPNRVPASTSQPEDPIVTICKLSHKIVWYLPTLIDIIYHRSMMAKYASTDLYLHCVPFVDDTLIPSYDSMDIFSDKFSNPTLTKLLSKSQRLLESIPFDENNPQIQSITPPIITDSMELNEWIVSIMFIQHVKPCLKLMILAKHLYGDPTPLMEKMIVPILNGIIYQCNFTGPTGNPSTSNVVPLVSVTLGGVVEVSGTVTYDVLFCKAVIALYYHSLEATLLEESKTNRRQPLDMTKETFHRAILCCCLLAVTRAIAISKKFVLSPNLRMLNIFSIVHVTKCSPYDLLLVTNRFIKAVASDQARKLGSPVAVGLPRILIFDFQQIEINIIDSLVWSRDIVSLAEPSSHGIDRTLPYKIEEIRLRQRHLGSTTDEQNTANLEWPPPPLFPTVHGEKDDEAVICSKSINIPSIFQETNIDNVTLTITDDDIQYITEIINKVLKLVYRRITTLCSRLNIPGKLPILSQVWLTCRYLLRHHIELLYDRHVDHWILCSLFGVLKAVNYFPVITFANIMEAHMAIRRNELGEATCHKIFGHIQLPPLDEGTTCAPSVGNIITLYNTIFLPTMKEYITHSPSLIRCCSQVKRESGSSKLGVLHVAANMEQTSDKKSAVRG